MASGLILVSLKQNATRISNIANLWSRGVNVKARRDEHSLNFSALTSLLYITRELIAVIMRDAVEAVPGET